MDNQSSIQYVGLIELMGNYYLQFRVGDKFWVYKFYARQLINKIRYMIKFSTWKALNQAKKKCVMSFHTPDGKEWFGHWLPDRKDEPKQSSTKVVLETKKETSP